MGNDADAIAELRAALERQTQEIYDLRAAVGHLVHGITASTNMSLNMSKVTLIRSMEPIAQAMKGSRAATLAAEREDIEAKIAVDSRRLDDALNAATKFVWDEDGNLRE